MGCCAGARGCLGVLGGTDRGETGKTGKRDVKDALSCGMNHGETCVDDPEGNFKSGPQSIFDYCYGEVYLGRGRRELDHVVCSPCRRETDTKQFIRTLGKIAPPHLEYSQNTQTKDTANGNFLARTHPQSPKHRHRKNQDTDIEDEVEDGAEKEFEREVAAMLCHVRTKLPVELERAAGGAPGNRASNQVGYGCRLEEVYGEAELLRGGEDLQDEIENG